MSIFKKLFNKNQDSAQDEEIKKQEVTLSLDDLFVHNFINKGGKFLYSTNPEDTSSHLIEILDALEDVKAVHSNLDLVDGVLDDEE